MKNLTLKCDITLSVEYQMTGEITDALIKYAKDHNTSVSKAAQLAVMSLIALTRGKTLLTVGNESVKITNTGESVRNFVVTKWSRI